MRKTLAGGAVVLLVLTGCASSDAGPELALPAACELARAPHASAEQRAELAERLAAGTGSPPDPGGPGAARRFEAFGKVAFAVFHLRSALDRERFAAGHPDEQTVDEAQEELARACHALRTA